MTDVSMRLPRLKFMLDCLLVKFRLQDLFERSYYSEITLTDIDAKYSLTISGRADQWSITAVDKDSDFWVEIEMNEQEKCFHMLFSKVEEGIEERFEPWFAGFYQRIANGLLKRALFESSPPTDFENRLEERISQNFQEATLLRL